MRMIRRLALPDKTHISGCGQPEMWKTETQGIVWLS